ncbi:P-loop containing nucleoside triphosphate hydrolase protein [Xylaria bambusicola]|uniref:P-loop containing nucleoside triphosphate hydrolase protein n=1 Tax=Xylaria bambusicola TaxID=326684 RepID=UPI0020076AC1|nr:P-loop containing nucleoside triphosphate hydrolase protein [Xylaria bambusicola]KAI0506293.1 P-loop containing nucleoside triphosphate hydrolase protein [Xylaria bambusicola]
MSEPARVQQQFGNTSVTDGSQAFQGIAHGDVAMNSTHHHYAAQGRPETPPKPTVVIPFNRDEDFVQRGTVLDQLHSLGKPASRTALVGFGGVGKSQIAIEYAFQIQERSPDTWVLWVHTSNVARYEQSLRDIADYVKLPERKSAEKNIFELLYNWLRSEKSKKWVLILDNVDDASFLVDRPSDHKHGQQEDSGSQRARPLASYLPHCQHGSILITSRSKREALKLVESHNIVEVQPMSEAEAVALAQNKLRKLATQESIKSIKSLTETLEYMPMAIVQATAYILRRDPHCSIQQYLVKFKQSDRKQASLLDYEDGQLRRDWEAKNSIIITWQVSFNHIREIRPSASDLLSLMSFCDRQGIPESLLRASREDSSIRSNPDIDNSRNNSECPDEETESESSENNEFNDDILILRDYSFISITEDRSTFEMHRLVQLATRRWLEVKGQQNRWKTEFITRLYAHFPTGAYENWGECRVLLPHVKSAVAQRPKSEASLLEWAFILHEASRYLLEMGQWHEAHKMAEDAIEVRMQIFGADHPDTLTSMNNLASIFWNQGRWEEAEKLEVEVLEIRKRKLGADHPDTLTSMSNLASTFWNQGRWEEAEKLQVKVLEIEKRKLGADHPDTLISMNNLASTFWNQGRWEEAEKLNVEVLEIEKRKLGADHPNTLISMNNLASTFWNQGRWEEAEKLEVEVLEIQKRKLGADHPDTLTSMNNLAITWDGRGRRSEALELMRECVSISQRTLGAHHPHYLDCAETLKTWELEHTNSNASA